MKTYDELKAMFLLANKKFLIEDIDLLDSMVSERALCGALMIHLNRLMVKDKSLEGYYTKIEGIYVAKGISRKSVTGIEFFNACHLFFLLFFIFYIINVGHH